MRILFITASRVGDAILSTGLLDHLLKRMPGAKVTVVCGTAAASLFQAVPGLERLIAVDKMAGSFHWPYLWARCLGFWDAVVDLRNSPLYYILPARQRWRIGKRRWDVHRVVQLASVMGLAEAPPAPTLWLGPEQERRAADLIPDGGPVLAVGPTANWRAKTWRPEYFAELIGRLTGPDGILPGARVAVLGRDDERPSALKLLEALPPERRIDLVGWLDLLEAYACLKRCAFYVGNDSGLMHLAAAAGIPTLGLFGPSPANQYGPWGTRTAIVQTAIPYAEIFPPNFNPKGADTLMDSLSVDMAEAGARKLWEACA